MNKLIKIIRSKKSILLLILILGALLRGVNLGSSPPGVLVDEASLGYNAYSILQTGRDEWGAKYPLTLKSFGDYKPAGYAYAAIPFIKLFGLNPLSTRLPSAIAGLVAIAAIYFICKSLLSSENVGILAASLLTISPWHIYISRMAWEANVSLTLFLVGLTLLLAKRHTLLKISIASLFFSLSCYFYVGYRIMTPILLLLFLFALIITKTIKPKYVLVFSLVFIILSLPLVSDIIYHGGASRFDQVSIFQKSGDIQYINEQRSFCGLHDNKMLLSICYLFWNKPTIFATDFMRNYINNFSLQFLFTEGDKTLFINNPNHGGIYYWLFIPFIVGLMYLLNGLQKDGNRIILGWLLISPIMPALADNPNFIRSNMVLIPVISLISLGIWNLQKLLKERLGLNSKIFFSIFLLICIYSVIAAMTDYFLVYTKKAMAWDEYYKDIYSYIKTVDKQYDKIYIKKTIRNPYIYTLFYLSLDPDSVQKNIKHSGFEVSSIGKYIFSDKDINDQYCYWLRENKPKTLFITNEESLYSYSVYYSTSYNKVYKLAVVYDFRLIQSYFQNKGKKFAPTCLVTN